MHFIDLMSTLHHFVRVDFERFKAFRRFTLHLRGFNVLVGPNNAGKSTVLAAFRILAVALRRAGSRNPDLIEGPNGEAFGYHVDMSSISVAEENIFYNYDTSVPAGIKFRLSNGNELHLHFSETGHCVLIAKGNLTRYSPSTFKKDFNCPIGFAPILGPVDHDERLVAKETASRALTNYSAARNFRNIWYYYPQRFEEFREILTKTWPGMDITRPELEYFDGKPVLLMQCPEDRIPREIFWAGFGFQVWCQMLTHLVQSKDRSLFLIDEPDIYLHSDLQRQLLSLLRNLGPDIIIATHSTEIITEAEPDDIVLVDKKRESARRLKDPSQLANVFSLLGSSLNPILTQLAKTRRAVFVEGKDFQIIGRFAQRLKNSMVSNRAKFAVVPLEGFNPQRLKNLKVGMETTLGGDVVAAAILDGDYRPTAERHKIEELCRKECTFVAVHRRKEIENFLLVPGAIDRAAQRRLVDRGKRTGNETEYNITAEAILDEFAEKKKQYVIAQLLAARRLFERENGNNMHEASINEAVLSEVEQAWASFDGRMSLIPGKEAIGFLNERLHRLFSISVTSSAIIEAMRDSEIPYEIQQLIFSIASFAEMPIAA